MDFVVGQSGTDVDTYLCNGFALILPTAHKTARHTPLSSTASRSFGFTAGRCGRWDSSAAGILRRRHCIAKLF
jgi:hypothetical protein